MVLVNAESDSSITLVPRDDALRKPKRDIEAKLQ